MGSFHARAAETAYAQPLTEELLADAAITPGMRVLVLGRSLADLAFLVAERVGPTGSIVAMSADPETLVDARRRAAEEGFDRVDFLEALLGSVPLGKPLDAVVGRFFLTYERDPVSALRHAAAAVHEGGRIVFQEWHYDSVGWPSTADWPAVPLYRRFASCALEGLRLQRAHADMGLRLANAFVEAGLPVPVVRSDLRIIAGSGSLGYGFFQEVMQQMLSATQGSQSDFDVETFAARLECETLAVGGHLFLPLQVGAYARIDGSADGPMSSRATQPEMRRADSKKICR